VGAGWARPRRFDLLRVAAAALIVLLALPWIAADLGTTFPEGIFLTERLGRDDDGTLIAAVHVGHHHGWDGALLVLTVLLLSRVRLRSPRLAVAHAVWLGALLAYGLVNGLQDLWLEQVVKRGWVAWEIPGAVRPDLTAVWLVIVAAAAVSGAVFASKRFGLRD
jgi:hypothetical protein